MMFQVDFHIKKDTDPGSWAWRLLFPKKGVNEMKPEEN